MQNTSTGKIEREREKEAQHNQDTWRPTGWPQNNLPKQTTKKNKLTHAIVDKNTRVTQEFGVIDKQAVRVEDVAGKQKN